jgi:hypothetical protein
MLPIVKQRDKRLAKPLKNLEVELKIQEETTGLRQLN